MKRVHGDTRKQKVAEVYREYQKQLRASNALDFDDLIFRTVELFQKEKRQSSLQFRADSHRSVSRYGKNIRIK